MEYMPARGAVNVPVDAVQLLFRSVTAVHPVTVVNAPLGMLCALVFVEKTALLLLAASVVNEPVLGVVAPTDVLLTVPPEIVGVLIVGVASVGDVPKTRAPLPVSSVITPASCADVVVANCDSGLPVRAIPD
jgi:hypothetical protein